MSLGKNQHIVRSFDKDLSKLKNVILNMIEQDHEILDKIYNLITNNNLSNKENIREIMNKADAVHEQDSYCVYLSLRILSLRNPVAYDLRFVFASSHISQNLERVCNNSSNILNQLTNINSLHPDVELKVLQIIHILTNMLHDLRISFDNSNTELIPNIIKQDEEVDRLHLEISDVAWDRSISQNNNLSELDNELKNSLRGSILICKFLERIGDHIVNVCKQVNFIEGNDSL